MSNSRDLGVLKHEVECLAAVTSALFEAYRPSYWTEGGIDIRGIALSTHHPETAIRVWWHDRRSGRDRSLEWRLWNGNSGSMSPYPIADIGTDVVDFIEES